MREARPAGVATQTILLLEIAAVTGGRWSSSEPWATIGDAISILALVALVVTVIVRWREIWALAADIRRKRRMLPTALMLIFAIGFVACFVWAQWPQRSGTDRPTEADQLRAALAEEQEISRKLTDPEEQVRIREKYRATEEEPPSAANSGDRSVTVGGDVNAPVITGDGNTINQAAPPQLEFLGSDVADIGNGYFRHTVRLNVKAPYPPVQLFVNVRAPGARHVTISPNRTGIIMKGHSGNRENASFDTLMQPQGVTTVVFEAKTNDIRTVHFDYNFGDVE